MGAPQTEKRNMDTNACIAPELKPEAITTEGGNRTAIRPPKRTEISLRVNYSDRELLDIGKKLAEANRELAIAEDEKKAVTSQLKARCDSIQGRIDEHSGQLTSGYTIRNVVCEIRFDEPIRGHKSTVRLDTMETVKSEPMTQCELQADLPMEIEEPAKSEGTQEELSFDSWDGIDIEELVTDEVEEFIVQDLVEELQEVLIDDGDEARSEEEAIAAFARLAQDMEFSRDNLEMRRSWLKEKADRIPGSGIMLKAIEAEFSRLDNRSHDQEGDLIRLAITLYREGKTIAEIATVTGLSTQKIKGALKGAGLITTKGRKQATAHGTVSVPSDEGSRDDVGEDSKNNL